jgi:hypothetical protein
MLTPFDISSVDLKSFAERLSSPPSGTRIATRLPLRSLISRPAWIASCVFASMYMSDEPLYAAQRARRTKESQCVSVASRGALRARATPGRGRYRRGEIGSGMCKSL